MTNTTHRPAHLRRIGLAALCIVLAYIGFASAAKTAGAATPVIVNNGAVPDRTQQKNWLSSTIVGGETNNNTNKVRIALLVQHDPGRKVTGLRIDEDYNGTDAAASATLRPVTAQQPVTINGYTYSRVQFEYTSSTGGLSSWSCSFLSQTWAQNKNIYLRAQLDNGDQTASSVSDLRFHKANDCNNPIIGSFQPYVYNQSQSATSVPVGGSVTFNYAVKNASTAAVSTSASGIKWRLRNSMTGEVTDMTAAGGSSATITFPRRGHWVVEAHGTGVPLLGGTAERNEWLYIGEVDVNSAEADSPNATLQASRPQHNGNTTITATGVSDDDAANGGLVQDVMWDLDENTTNGLNGFESEVNGAYNASPAASAFTRTIDTTGMTTGWHPVRMKLRDNGAMSGADDSRREPVFTSEYLVNSFPTADSQDPNVESDQTLPITLTGSDPDVWPTRNVDDNPNLAYTITDGPDHGSLSTPTGSGEATATYNPDDDFSGYDDFTFQVDDGYGGTDTAVVTVRVDPATDYVTVPDTVTEHNDRSVAPTFSSPTEGSTFVKFECSLDFTDWYDCESADVINDLDDGLHNLRVRANGGEDTVDPTPAETEWVIDAKPTVTFTSTPTPDSGDSAPSFEFDVTEPGHTVPFDVSCKVTGPDQAGEFLPCSSPFELTDLEDGDYTLTVLAKDQFGKETTATYEWEIAIGGVHTWIDEGPAVFGNSSDADFVFGTTNPDNTYECSLDGDTWTVCETPYSLIGLDDGAHTLEVRAVSPTDIADSTPASWSFTIDTVEPTTTINGASPARTNQPLDLTFESSEPDSTFLCSLDDAEAEPCSTPFMTLALADGEHTLRVAAVDRAGNIDSNAPTRTWTLDTVAPHSTVTDGPAPGSLTNESAAEFEFEADEDATFQCRLDEQSWRDCDESDSTAYAGLADGEHVFRIRATDLAGNQEAAAPTLAWNVDTIAPVAGIDDGPAGTLKTAAASFKFSSSEEDVTFECRLDDGDFDTCLSPQPYTGLGDGDHTFAVRAVDAAGNSSEHPAMRSWSIDTSTEAPPEKKPDPKPESTCNLKSAEAKCASPVLTAMMKKIGKKAGKNNAVAIGLDAGKTPLGGTAFSMSRGMTLALTKKAKGKHIAQAVLKSADGTSTTVRLGVPKGTKPGARGKVKLTGPTSFSASIKRGKAPSIMFAGLPENVTSVAVGLRGKGLTIKSKGCATQSIASALTDREGNSAKVSTFVDPPCLLKKKTKGAR